MNDFNKMLKLIELISKVLQNKFKQPAKLYELISKNEKHIDLILRFVNSQYFDLNETKFFLKEIYGIEIKEFKEKKQEPLTMIIENIRLSDDYFFELSNDCSQIFPRVPKLSPTKQRTSSKTQTNNRKILPCNRF